MDLASEMIGDRMVVTVQSARIDAAAAIQFKDKMRVAAEGSSPKVLLDLSQVDFIDSSGLGAIVGVMKCLAPERRLDLASLQPNVERVFRLTRMDSVFIIYPSREEALRTHAH
ncbi:STAS domain-containing protein [Pseudooceanicola nanhaiensis]|uniref:STAS domain-containing protein n=1 Tax=Pseudooceanicola nanhaiensis TaxID=375761 RepID=UPI001CD6553D|nr:STAS domain-containing protein [Pseudooceanicola nanhaiensis]MCA0921456.1 STAS domain-containing protein [Pseudooceanicola nanhaiensis]